MVKRSKADKRRRRKKAGKTILKGLQAGNRFLKKTKVISKLGREFGKNDPRIMVGAQILDQLGYGFKIHPSQMGRGKQSGGCSGPRGIKV